MLGRRFLAGLGAFVVGAAAATRFRILGSGGITDLLDGQAGKAAPGSPETDTSTGSAGASQARPRATSTGESAGSPAPEPSTPGSGPSAAPSSGPLAAPLQARMGPGRYGGRDAILAENRLPGANHWNLATN